MNLSGLTRLPRSAGTHVLRMVAPRLLWKMHLHMWNWGTPDAEMKLLPYLCDRRKTSVDIGACLGIYTMGMLCYSRDCVAFEARPDRAADLRTTFRMMKAPVTVHPVALSDRAQTTQLRICRSDLGLTTISQDHPLEGAVDTVEVRTQPLDAYGLADVGCIKIDVEGHEEAVLTGAEKTLRGSVPNLIIELDDRRNPGRIASVRQRLRGLGMRGFFVHSGQLRPIEEFDAGLWQRQDAVPYLCNFIFVPQGRTGRLPRSRSPQLS